MWVRGFHDSYEDEQGMDQNKYQWWPSTMEWRFGISINLSVYIITERACGCCGEWTTTVLIFYDQNNPQNYGVFHNLSIPSKSFWVSIGWGKFTQHFHKFRIFFNDLNFLQSECYVGKTLYLWRLILCKFGIIIYLYEFGGYLLKV